MVTVPAVPPNTADAGVVLSQATLLVPLNQFAVAPAVQLPTVLLSPPPPFGPHCNWAGAELVTARQAGTAADNHKLSGREARNVMSIRLRRGRRALSAGTGF